jgi:hypothetical protein
MDTVHSQLATDPLRLGEIDSPGKTESRGIRRRETDDLVQRRPKQFFLTIVPRLRHRVPQAENPSEDRIRKRSKRESKTQENRCLDAAFLRIELLHEIGNCLSNQWPVD